MVVLLVALSRSVDDPYDCVSSVIIGTSKLTNPTKEVILAVERDLLAVMIKPRVPLTVVEQSTKGAQMGLLTREG